MPRPPVPSRRSKTSKKDVAEEPIFPKEEFAQCPIATALDALGKRWSLPILRKIDEFHIERFNHLLKVLPGISHRVLATNLKDLERAGLVLRVAGDGRDFVRWKITEKGKDAIPVARMMTAYAARWYPTVIFGGMKPRNVSELYSPQTLALAKRRLAETQAQVTADSLPA